MILGIGCLTAMDALAKALVELNLNPIQVLGLRMFVIVPAILIVFGWRGKLPELAPTRLRFQIIRGCIGFFAPFCFFLSLKFLPLSNAVVVSYSSIMMITILSHVFLDEKVGVHRWSAVVLGFIGVYIAASPSGEGELLGYFLVFGAALSYAVLFVTGRHLSRTESVGSLVFVFNCCTGLISLCLMPLVWIPVDLWGLVMIGALGILAVCGHFCIVLAFTHSQASLVAPFEYTSLIWAILIEGVIWQYFPGLNTLMGATLIITAGLYVIYRENKLHKVAKAVHSPP